MSLNDLLLKNGDWNWLLRNLHFVGCSYYSYVYTVQLLDRHGRKSQRPIQWYHWNIKCTNEKSISDMLMQCTSIMSIRHVATSSFTMHFFLWFYYYDEKNMREFIYSRNNNLNDRMTYFTIHNLIVCIVRLSVWMMPFSTGVIDTHVLWLLWYRSHVIISPKIKFILSIIVVDGIS